MDWDDVEDIIFDGTEEEINAVRCPECGGHLKLSFFPDTRNLEIECLECGTLVRGHGVGEVPNFALVMSK